VSLVIDAGALSSTPSTLVNVRSSPAVVEREGMITSAAVAVALKGPL
jgi:tRNA A37 threonylcarbamoyladenosine synthetase subunit TsaC/SUA5/YrdC